MLLAKGREGELGSQACSLSCMCLVTMLQNTPATSLLDTFVLNDCYTISAAEVPALLMQDDTTFVVYLFCV